jgi:small subunit ribosomal protein S2
MIINRKENQKIGSNSTLNKQSALNSEPSFNKQSVLNSQSTLKSQFASSNQSNFNSQLTPTNQSISTNQFVLNSQEAIEAGLNLGCPIFNLHPKMKPYIAFSKNKFNIIALPAISESIATALKFINEISTEGKQILLVGTRPQDRKIVCELATGCDLPFINQKWIPGLFTNFKTILRSATLLENLKAELKKSDETKQEYISHLNETEKKDKIEKKNYLTKKESLQIKKKIEMLEKKIQGIKNMKTLPAAVFILDCNKEKIAIQEAKKMGIKIIAIINTDANPTIPDYPIFANNKSIVSLKYILEQVKKVVTHNQNTK